MTEHTPGHLESLPPSVQSTPGGQTPFPPAEWSRLQADDRLAGKVLVLLMAGIFTVGLCLYIGVCLMVYNRV